MCMLLIALIVIAKVVNYFELSKVYSQFSYKKRELYTY